MTLEERKEELRKKLAEASSVEELNAIEEEIRSLNEEETTEEVKDEPKTEEVVEEVKEEKEPETISKEEERSLIKNTSNVVEERNLQISKIFNDEGETKMEERKFGIDSAEYRSAWAKSLMGLSDDKFTEDEKRALGDAVTTTSTTFVKSDASTQGINNGGLFIPSTVRNDLMEIIEQQSPIYRDIRKLQVQGNIDLPYLFEADNAEWYSELNDTKNEGQEYRSMQLTGFELAKNVVVTWKLEEMAVDSFISFIIDELAHKMGIALVTAILYGDGNGKPTGITNGLTPVITGETPIDTLIDTYKSLSKEARIGAKGYISTDNNIAIVGYKDKNGNYPFLQGIATNALVSVEVDPYLNGYDMVVGNPRFYILNENTPLRVDRETSVKSRKVTYGGYAIYDGKAKPNAFAMGTHTPSV